MKPPAMARARKLLFIALSIAALWASVASAQTGPNFSGTWEPVGLPEATASAQVQTVVHTKDTLTLGHRSEHDGHKFAYKTDGSENRSTLMNVESVATVTVTADGLTIARVDKYPDGRIRENRQVWTLDPAGNLVIESTDGLKGEPPTTRKQVYRKRTVAR